MLQLKDICYSIADRPLLRNVNATINPGKRAALIGRNGAGKTTLLRVLTGDLQPDSGEISKAKTYTIGYLPQEQRKVDEGNILEVVLKSQPELAKIEAEMQRLQAELDSNSDDKKLNRLGELEERFDRLGGYSIEADAKAILSGLGFSSDGFQKPLSEYSGGWRMRVHLARLLLQRPDLLLLDEPTNHLDLESLEWLEQYLRSFEGSMLIVSHDRFFIDRLSHEIFELDRGKLTQYAGNFSFYEKKKAEDTELLLKRIEEQKAEIARIQRFIDRFRYKASKAPQVQSRIKMLEKIEVLEPPPPELTFRFNISTAVSSYKDVLQIKDMWFKYETDWVLKGVDLNIYRGEKIALVGVNGAGKTTLTRLVCQQLMPQQGAIVVGERVDTGYYAQHQVDTLNLEATVMDEVAETAAETHRANLRDVLGLFQFSGDAPQKRVGVLSGGEKARVSLAKILLSPVNFLIMDEPTNHLDMVSQKALEHALREYDGTLLLISHDRYFLDQLVERVVEIKDGTMSSFEGNYTDYLNKRMKKHQEEAKREFKAVAVETEEKQAAPTRKTKEQKREEAEARQRISKERKRLQTAIEKNEQQIAELETRIGEIETEMADPSIYNDGAKAASLQKEYSDAKARLANVYEEWENAQLELEALLTELG